MWTEQQDTGPSECGRRRGEAGRAPPAGRCPQAALCRGSSSPAAGALARPWLLLVTFMFQGPLLGAPRRKYFPSGMHHSRNVPGTTSLGTRPVEGFADCSFFNA